MIKLFILAGLLFSLAWGGMFLENKGGIASEAGNIMLSAAPFLMVFIFGYFLYMTLLAKPKCPKCGNRLDGDGSVELDDGSMWRMVSCPKCQKKYRIPGLSEDR
jgi:hypothetical protein